MRSYLILISVLALTGCATAPQPKQLTYAEQCTKLGYVKGTALFLKCYNNLQTSDDRRIAAMAGALVQQPAQVVVRPNCTMNEIIAHVPGC